MTGANLQKKPLRYPEGSFRSIGKLLAVSLEKCEISAILISFIAVFSGALSILDQKMRILCGTFLKLLMLR